MYTNLTQQKQKQSFNNYNVTTSDTKLCAVLFIEAH